jgi:zinc D-Ala-D-Ala dipeptidase
MNLKKSFLLLSLVAGTLLLAASCSHQNELAGRNPYNLDLVQTIRQYKELVTLNSQNAMVNLGETIEGIALDIRYATADNFTGEVIYSAPKAYARKPVAEALQKVEDSLSTHNIGLQIYDAYRPYAASLKFFEVYPDTNFVANPRYGSRHNRGCAIDLTLIELTTGQELPMPSEFDDFSARAHPDYGELPDTVLANRAFLFGVMSHFGFSHYPTEWWHFDFGGWESFKLMDLSFEELERVL